MIRKILAGVLAILFVLLFLPFSFAFGIYFTLSDEDFYKGELIDITYEFVVEEVPEAVDLENFPALERDDLRDIFKNTFEKEDVKIVIDDLVRQFNEIKISQESTVKFAFPMNWLIEKKNEIAGDVAGHMYDNLEPCDENIKYSKDEVLCIPSGMSRNDLEKDMVDIFNEEFSDIPGELIIELEVPENFKGDVSGLIDSGFNIVFLGGFIVLTVILILMVLLVFRPWPAVMKWISGTIFLSSLIVSLVIWGLRFLPEMIIKMEEYEIYIRAYTFIVSEIMKNVLYWLLPLMIVSFVFWIFGICLYKRKIKYGSR